MCNVHGYLSLVFINLDLALFNFSIVTKMILKMVMILICTVSNEIESKVYTHKPLTQYVFRIQ